MTELNKRFEVYPSDIEKLSGKTRKAAYGIRNIIRHRFDIGRKEPITVIHLARYYHSTVEDIEKRMAAIS